MRRSLDIFAFTCVLLAVSALFCLHLAELLNDSGTGSQFWPADIRLLVARLLGGTVDRTAGGDWQVTVLALPVWLRLVAALLLTSAIVWFRRTNRVAAHADWKACCQGSSAAMMLGMAWWLVETIGQTAWPAAGRFAVTAAPLWTMTSLAAVILALLLAVARRFAQMRLCGRCGRRGWGFALLIATGAWAMVSYWMNFQLYQLLLIPHGDSAMYEEHLWNVWHGKGFRSYLDQGLFAGEHFQVIHLLLLPLHMLWPSHLLLELAETAALASCTIPLYRIALRYGQRHSTAALLGMAWLFYFPMHFLDIAVDQKTFRPICLALPFLFWMIDFAERRQIAGTLICLLVALSAKEDVALVTAPLLGVLAVLHWRSGRSMQTEVDGVGSRRAVRWLAGASVFSIGYLVAVVLVGIPAFRDGDVVHYSRYFGELGSSPGELIRNSLARPGLLLGQLFSVRTLVYLLVFLAPLGFMPLRRPFVLLAGLPSFAMLSLLQFSDDSGGLPPVPYHHFHAPLLPVLFWAAAAGLQPLHRGTSSKGNERRWMQQAIAWLPDFRQRPGLWMLLCSVLTGVVASPMPWGTTFWSKESPLGYRNLYVPVDPAMRQRAAMANVVEQQIPMSARVAATDFIHTRLTHRERSYDYSNYPRAVNNNRPGAPPDADFIVIDTQHRYSEISSVDQIPEYVAEPEAWLVVPDRTRGFFIILQRRSQSAR